LSLLEQALIRDMGPDDVSAVARLEAASYAFPWSEGIFRDCLRAHYYCCVAQLDSQCIGYAIMSAGAGEAHVLNLCVAEEWRRQGLGAALLQQLLDYAEQAGAREIFLEVRPSNTGALRLYKANGFAHIGVRRGYYQAVGGREDAVVLRRHLSPRTR